MGVRGFGDRLRSETHTTVTKLRPRLSAAVRLTTIVYAAELIASCGGHGIDEPAAPETVATTSAPSATTAASTRRTPRLRAEALRPELRGLTLRLDGGAWAGGRLMLDVSLENTAAATMRAPGLTARAFRLTTPDGRTSAPLDVTESMEAMTTERGMPPASRHVGQVVFMVPASSGWHELSLEGFPPLAFDARTLPSPGGNGLDGRSALAAADGLPRELDEVLVAQAAALRERDHRRYATTLAPELRAGAADVEARLRAADVGAVGLRLVALRGKPNAAGVVDAAVELSYWLADIPDDDPFVHLLVYRFARFGGGWVVQSVAAAPGEQMPFWSEPGVTRLPSDHFVVYTRSGTTAQLLEVSHEAEAAYARLQALRLPLARRYAVHVLPEEQFASILGGSAIGAAAGRYTAEANGVRVDNVAFYLNGELFEEGRDWVFTREARRETVRHELVHLALIKLTRPTTPIWLVEGAAVYFSGGLAPDTAGRLAPHLAALEPLPTLSSSRSLVEHGRTAAALYEYSGLAVEYIVNRFGMDAFSRLYHAFAQLPPDRAITERLAFGPLGRGVSPGPATQADELARESLGVGLGELDAGLRTWISAAPRPAARRAGSSRP